MHLLIYLNIYSNEQLPHIFHIYLVYLDAGTLPGDTAMITFTFDSTVGTGDFSRFWDIKVTQIPCNSKYEYVKVLYISLIHGG